jgi:hypothetical protein
MHVTPLYTAPVAAQPSVRDGWKLVPIEPTSEMLIRGSEEFFDSARNWKIGSTLRDQDHASMIYEGMLAAAPTPPAVEQPISDALRDAVTHGIGIMRIDPTEIYQSSAQQRSMQAAIDDKALDVARSITAMRQTPEIQWLARIQIAVAEVMEWAVVSARDREWQPIETAPKDGSTMLLRGKGDHRIADGYWLQDADKGCGAWVWPYVHSEPIHWMPLPPFPPTQDQP